MGCCFSSQASSAASHGENQRPVTPPQQISHEQGDTTLPEAIVATTPIAAPIAISGVEQGAAIIDAITPNEAGPSSSESRRSESSASRHIILEPTVYVPPSRTNDVAELDVTPIQSAESGDNHVKNTSSSSSSSSSSSGSGRGSGSKSSQ
ncbi:hypothetical protein CI102_10952 [Trichoderma harzianum]|uniref:Uncharacterized protein n=1 Tax=Trichoderma harzianum CBS 226.95 TaxID=983964 RepID=A0A2T4AE03_TRIHA|nr:hypothetical protein M431DRAFT_83356 [Trichoderma harzianum CBS 226.95]PKK44766.1 hypothetical protein CI102_10952 [Trichoderma harzianum]PTB55311.1 hypothetical protein M431DRAFT_83356 [Trichoderma harzianum CBS 226.95]